MPAPPTVLFYGHDELLLDTRREIFERAGFRARGASDFREMSRELGMQHCDLIILCHSLSPAECVQAMAMARDLTPAVPTLMLVAGEGLRSAEPLPCNACLPLEGPEALLARVDRLLGFNHQTHAHG